MSVRTRRLAVRISAIAAIAFGAFAAAGVTDVEPGLDAAKSGLVLDATGKPIADVYVGVRWMEQTRESALFGGKLEGRCLYRAIVRTDAAGRYSIPAPRDARRAHDWRPAERKYFWDLYTYAAGYAAAENDAHPAIAAGDARAVQLAPLHLAGDRAAGAQPLAALTDTLAHFTCRPFAQDAGPVEQQIVAQAAAAACLTGGNDADASCVSFRQASNHAP